MGLFFLVFSLLASAYMLASFSLPQFDGTQRLAGVDANIDVIRDAQGIPHIFAKTRHDTYFALGYIHAMDRLWQMDMSRMLTKGRLSERFGIRALPTDKLMRALDLDGHAEASLSALSDETLEVLDAYAEGVNARIRQVEEDGLGRGAPEFYVFGGEIEPWTPADSMSVLKAMAFQLSRGALAKEVKRGRFLLSLEADQVRDLFPDYPGQGVSPYPRLRTDSGMQAERMARVDLPVLGDLLDESAAGASNAWAVDGTHSSSRAPLLAADPHLTLSAPSTWHPVQISGPGIELIGGSLPGIPAIVIGRNASIAWGITAAEIDDTDVFIEQVDPDNPTRYKTPDGWEEFEIRKERLEIRSDRPISLTLQRTRHGPVLPINLAGLASVTPRNHVPVMSWTALSDDDTSLEALLQLNQATNVSSALRAIDSYVAPAVNLVVADAEGIGMGVAGRVPLRRLTSKIQGRAPSPGWEDAHDWVGWVDPASLPKTINPPDGVVANANNRVGTKAFPRHLSFDWDAPYRLNRINKQLEARSAHSVESFSAMQQDVVSEMARAVAPLIGEEIWNSGDEEGAHPLRGEALSLLEDWNGSMDEHRPEALIFTAWLDALIGRVTADELGALQEYYRGARPLFIERVYRDIDGAGRWCDDVTTDEIEETCADLSKMALDEALVNLSETYGRVIARWRWGQAHEALHKHRTLGDVGTTIAGIRLSLGPLVNIVHESSGGDFTLNRGAFTHVGPQPYANVHAAGLRVVYDLADLNRSKFIVSTGASGHFLSRYYKNLSPIWRVGELVPMSTDREVLESGALGTLTITPDQEVASPMLP